MQLTDWFCYAFLAITVTASYAEADNEQPRSLAKPTEEKNISKREAALLIETYPGELYRPNFNQRAIYRRVSRYPYRKPKPTYRSPRPKHGQSKRKKPRYSVHRYPSYKYGSPSSQKKGKKRAPSRYPPQFNKPKSIHSSKRKPVVAQYHAPEPSGFGEPPVDYNQARPPLNHKPSYEPPVDSYGAPLKNIPSGDDAYGYNQDFFDTPMQNLDEDNFDQNEVGFNRWHQDHRNYDHSQAYSKKRPSYVRAESKPDEDHSPLDFNQEFYHPSHDVYNYAPDRYPRPKEKYPSKKAPTRHLNQPWRSKLKVSDDQHLVGGQYAEPPARYVPKFQPSAAMYAEDEESFGPSGPTKGFDGETSASAAISSYVNYKNSNMAFSPQNLNDAFSIVD